MFPESTKFMVRATRSNGKGDPRVFHYLSPGAIRTPLHITDQVLFKAVSDEIGVLADEFSDSHRKYLAEKVNRRAARYGKHDGW